MLHLLHIGIEERGREKDQNENMASKNETFRFRKTVNILVGKDLKLEGIRCWELKALSCNVDHISRSESGASSYGYQNLFEPFYQS